MPSLDRVSERGRVRCSRRTCCMSGILVAMGGFHEDSLCFGTVYLLANS